MLRCCAVLHGRCNRARFPSADVGKTIDLVAGQLKCCFTSTETVGLLGTGAEDVHLDFHTAPELCDLQ